MSGTILPSYGPRTFGVPAKNSGAKPTGIQSTSFGDMAARASKADAYKKYLEKRFGPVTVQSVGKDRASLEAAGKRMRGNDIVIAPNIFAEMVSDPQKAAYYEQKISYFFTDVIPKGTAWAASVGLTFEPCGVVIHEDGTVTYICGGGDSPERVAEVNRINREKAEKQAEQQRLYLEQTAAALERATFNIRDLRFVRKG